MKISVLTLATLGLFAARSVPAQQVEPQCADPAVVGGPGVLSSFLVGGDACQKAVDLFRYMNVQFGTLIAGGNATLGQGGTLGGLGHFTVEVRVNGFQSDLPDVAATGVTAGPAQSSAYTTTSKWVALPVADAAIGLFKGIPLGITRVGGVDALVSAAYLPTFNANGVDVSTPDGSIKWGFGARLGILGETALVPGVSFTWLRRDLPTTTIVGVVSPTERLTVEDMSLHTTAWRAVVSKNFLIVGLAAGVGQDKYDGKASLTYDISGVPAPNKPVVLETDPTRTNIFADLSLNLMVLKITGEIGRVSGGDVATFNTFDPKATDPRTYGSVGIRLGF